MSDEMKVLSFDVLLSWILGEFDKNESIFGIHRSLFYTPRKDGAYASQMFGRSLATPFGPAAGPHTQLTENIISAWLSGGRFIELKTVQIMDDLEIPRPCIDMEDEGYNVEWSQELKLDQSAWEYIKAWVLIRILRRLLGFEELPFGTIFNMSIGYNLEGIRTAPMQRFMDRMEDASEELASIQEILQARFPQFADLEVPPCLTNSVTLSTMHGCPPDEIEAIARYLLEERGLHTIVKLNPTLLGRDAVMDILQDRLGYNEIDIPDSVFEHDLKYERAVSLIASLKETAARQNLTFGVKLSNTLAMANHRGVLPGDEMYMSGRALYPITMNLFHRLVEEFDGDLNVSYSAGADAFNAVTILACGARPITAASDLLKPGGYSRMVHWLENLEVVMQERGAASLAELAHDRRANLGRAAADALISPQYKKHYFAYGLPKVESGLDLFDCVAAPCTEKCAVCQDVPEYAWLIGQGEYDRALQVILHRNPLPGVTGYVCTHLCQTRCTRNNYDEPVAIRALKRFAFERGSVPVPPPVKTGRTVAIIGSGPSGLSAAFYLALNGVQATIFEAREIPGGMLAIAPHFRIPPSVVQEDIERIKALGVEVVLDHRVTVQPEELLDGGFEAVYVATGFQRDAVLDIEGIHGEGTFTALSFLEMVARGEEPDLKEKVLVIGGGNTAMDAARTAQRLTGRPSTVVYRRTQSQAPAEEEELAWLFEEGNKLVELASPKRVILKDGRVAALECVRNQLGEPDPDGRRRPVPVEGSEFQIEAGAIILAIGQQPDIAFLDGTDISFRKDGSIMTDPESGMTGAQSVYAGGDVVRGPDIIIAACADGRRAAEAICDQLGVEFQPLAVELPQLSDAQVRQVKQARARKAGQRRPEMLSLSQRGGFACVEQTLSEEAAQAEAGRCLQCSTVCDKCVEVCPNRANYSFQVEPVNWTLPLLACHDGGLSVTGREAFAIVQKRQILHLDDLCNECGNCATFCVHQGKPYSEKPRLFLQESDFELENDNAFYIAGSSIRRREGGQEATLSIEGTGFRFESPQVELSLSVDRGFGDWQVRESVLAKAFEGALSLRAAAEMAVILKGVAFSLPFFCSVM